jgi:hypothetical protein
MMYQTPKSSASVSLVAALKTAAAVSVIAILILTIGI